MVRPYNNGVIVPKFNRRKYHFLFYFHQNLHILREVKSPIQRVRYECDYSENITIVGIGKDVRA